MKDRLKILSAISDERNRQDEKWGVQDWPLASEGERLVSKELESGVKEICDRAARSGSQTWYKILGEEFYEAFAAESLDEQIKEMTQVAAVAVAIIECLERKKKSEEPDARSI